VNNRCLIRASALSFSSLLALIPMLAVAIGVTSGLLKSQGEDQIYAAINKFVATMVPPAALDETNPAALTTVAIPTNSAPDTGSNALAQAVSNSMAVTNGGAAVTVTNEDRRMITAQKEVARSIHEFVQNTRSGTLGVVGILLLVWAAIAMLANIEATFNDIWGVTRGRPWFWRIVLYWFTLTLGPMALVGAYSLIGIHMAEARAVISQMPVIGGLIFEAVPLAILWLVFSLVYLTVPNTKVQWRAALVGGLVGGSLWHLNNVLGYLYISRFVTNSMIYGSLGLVPVLMIGLYTSWVILLLGGQVSYAYQNRRSYLQDKFAENVNQRGREFIALRLMTCLGLRYQNAHAPATVGQIAGELGISTRLTQQIVQPLLAGRLITEVAGAEAAYCPARPLDNINAHDVLLAVRSGNKPVACLSAEPVRDEIYGEFARIEEAERVAAAAVTMQALVDRAGAKLAGPAIGSPAVPLTLPNTAAGERTLKEVGAVEVTLMPAPETMAQEVPSVPPAPEKPRRRIVVPEDNHDFPL
jgi:membrane protein